METKFNFNSQVCTSRSQSERLLALGLKKETADCCYIWRWESDSHFLYANSWKDIHSSKSDIPAWSLHRLIEMIQKVFVRVNLCGWWVHIGRKVHNKEYFADVHYNLFDNIIDCIEWLIKEGYFPKEYLDGTTEN